MTRPSLFTLLLLLLGASGAQPAVGWAEAAPRAGAALARIGGLHVSESNGVTTIVVKTTGRPTFTTFKLDKPPRVVVDVTNARLGDVEVPFEADTFAVGAMAATTSEDEGGARTRFFFTLRRPGDFAVRSEGDDIVLVVSPREKPPAAVQATARVETLEAQGRVEQAERVADENRKRAERAEAATAEALRRAADAEKLAEAARLREEERGNAVAVAQAQADAHRRALDDKQRKLDEQERRLADTEAVVQARAADVVAARRALEDKERGVAEAARQQVAAKAGRSRADMAEANAMVERARQARLEAAEAARASHKALQQAEQERSRLALARRTVEAERAEEQRKWQKADGERKALEGRRLEAEAARRREEERLVAAVAERKRLEADRASVEAEVRRLRGEKDAATTMAKAVAAVAAVAAARPQAPAQRPAASPPRTVAVTLAPPSRVQRVDFFEDRGQYTLRIDLDAPTAHAPVVKSERQLTLRLLHAELPRGLQRTQDATEYLGPVRLIHSFTDPDDRGVVRVVVDLAEDVPQRVRQEGSTLYWEFEKPRSEAGGSALSAVARTRGRSLDPRVTSLEPVRTAGWSRTAGLAALPAVFAQAATSPPPSVRSVARKRYTGRRIDLDLKNADIHNLLRLLSDIGQVNIVTSEDVRGEITIKMKNVPWDQALDIVLRAKQLGQVREGNLIRVAPIGVLEKEIEQEIQRQKQLTEVLPTETRLIGVSYATASGLQDRVKDLLSQRGKVSVDERTNHLIVTDVAKNLALVEELVRNLDTQTSQVVIEARIVEARSTFARQFGIQWGFDAYRDVEHGNPTGLFFPHNFGVAGGASDGQTPLSGLVPGPRTGNPTAANNPNFLVNFPVGAGTGSGTALGFTFGSLTGAFNMNLRLTALESTGQIRIVSSPRVSTLDNVSASISQGVSVPISVVSASGVQTQFVDAVLNLTVKPHVTNEGTVIMDIAVTRNEPDFGNTGARGDPTILRKEAKTQLLVRDGDTAVIGGIYTRNSGVSVAKIPFFADLPFLGVLFRNRRENDDRAEFLVFITPRITNRARATGQ